MDQLTRANTKLISSIGEPVYTILYVTAQARNSLMNVSASNLSLAIAGNVICRIQNNSAKLLTSVESILVNSSAGLGYSIIKMPH